MVTMDPQRRVLRDSSVAIADGQIAAIGKTSEIVVSDRTAERLGGSRFVVVPGLVDGHVHITGEPLTKGLAPDDVSLDDWVKHWMGPLYAAHNEDEERVSTLLAVAERVRNGTTTFLEAGTVSHLEAVVAAINEVGARARVGRWVWDLPPEPAVYRRSTGDAIAVLEAELAITPVDGSRVRVWPNLLGRNTCSDDLWRAAKELADSHGAGVGFHLSPTAADPEESIARYGKRPLERLADLGVLGPNATMTHAIWLDDRELELLRQSGSNVVHCPMTALKLAYGASGAGRMPEMVTAGVTVALGTDGANAANSGDLYRAVYLAAGLFKDARVDPSMMGAHTALELATIGGARALLMEDEVGSIEVGKRADLVLHDRATLEWSPLVDVVSQLVYATDGRSVHTVLIDGEVVVDDHHLVHVDEERLRRDAQHASRAIIERAGVAPRMAWPVS